MPKSALPPWIKEQAAGTGTDWNNWIQRYWNKSWFAYGPRATGWAKWREWPITLFALRSKEGEFRLETETYERDTSREDYYSWRCLFNENNFRLVFWNGGSEKEHREITRGYLSPIQYWTKWHIQIQWPFFIAAHYYLDEVPTRPNKYSGKRVLYFRFGARRDADKVYWFPSIFIGTSWN